MVGMSNTKAPDDLGLVEYWYLGFMILFDEDTAAWRVFGRDYPTMSEAKAAVARRMWR